jgi:NitT/TauT family transport system ATP-binding protein
MVAHATTPIALDTAVVSAIGESLVTLRDVSITFSLSSKNSVVAVQSVTADIFRGEKFVLLGPSGCGKSTLLAAMAGFIPVTAGSITINGRRVRRPSMNSILVFQDFGQLFPWRTVQGNVEWGLRRRWPSLSAAEVEERARHYVELVGLGRQALQYPNTLSGGQKQRGAIARAFAVSPDILLMDEPFGALDAINRERMQAELNRIWESNDPKTTVVFVTHDVNEAVHLGHRIMVMSRGPGRIRAIVENPHVGIPPYDRAALGLVGELRELLKEEGE